MIRDWKKYFFSAALCLVVCSSSIYADEKTKKSHQTEPNSFYIGGFGGWGYLNTHVAQKGTAFLPAASGGNLYVDATGKSNDNSFGFGGLHLGYEWRRVGQENWSVVPGVEVEGYYYSETVKADLENDSYRLDFHEFTDTLPMRTGTMLANLILALSNDPVEPYLGLGVGAGYASIHDADSLQTDPPEPGINHFNSDTDATDWTFAFQVKVGLRFQVLKWMRLFGEYRFLYYSPTTFTFGSTQYPTHVATSNWDVHLSDMRHNLFALGIDFTF